MHDYFMDQALQEARKALAIQEVPIGAIVVNQGNIVGRGHNQRETLQDPTAHAEIIALREAAKNLGSWRLTNATIYVTLEPCPMCAGAIVNARIKILIYGVNAPKTGAVSSLMNIVQDRRLNHQVEVIEGIREDACSRLLKEFFSRRRKLNLKER